MSYICPDHELIGGWLLKNGKRLYICVTCGIHIEYSADAKRDVSLNHYNEIVRLEEGGK